MFEIFVEEEFRETHVQVLSHDVEFRELEGLQDTLTDFGLLRFLYTHRDVFLSHFYTDFIWTIHLEMSGLLANRAAFFFLGDDLLSDNVEIWFVRAKPEHNEISVCSVETVFRVWIVVFGISLDTNKIENFMFTFTWNSSVREDDLEVLE